MALVSRARARFKFFGTFALALAQFLARTRAHEKSRSRSSALAFNSVHQQGVSFRLLCFSCNRGFFLFINKS